MSGVLLDIVMLVHDQGEWADLAIRAVEHHTKVAYRLIIVDMASTEERTLKILKDADHRGHEVIHLAANRSFSNGVNVGVAAGSGKFIAILNDDAIVTEGWDGALIQDASDKFTGLVGARSNYASGFQGDPTSQGEPPYLVFVCVALRRAVWDLLGPMDEQTFDGFSSEDIDYSWRVVKAGLKLKVSAAYVLHAGSRTLARTQGDAEARRRNDLKYNARLVEKWGKEWVAEHARLQQKALVATFHGDVMTRVAFMEALMGFRRADGMGAGPSVGCTYTHVVRAPIHMAREKACNYALDEGFDYLVMIDDDALFPSDAIRRLLAHQKEVVCMLAYQRKPPHATCAITMDDKNQLGGSMEGIERTGIRKVDVSGMHFCALRTSVIKKLRDFKDEQNPDGIRQYFGSFSSKLGEDFNFCLNLKKVGVPVYVDTDLIAGHIGDAINVDEAYVRKYRESR